MAIPARQDLVARQKRTRDRLEKLKKAYRNFITEWEKIEQEEKDLLRQANTYVDQAKIRRVSDIIKKSDD